MLNIRRFLLAFTEQQLQLLYQILTYFNKSSNYLHFYPLIITRMEDFDWKVHNAFSRQQESLGGIYIK